MDSALRGQVHDLVLGTSRRGEPWKRGARAILIDEARDLLQGTYGVHENGRVEPLDRLPNLAEDAEARETYRRLTAHLSSEQEAGLTGREAVDKLVKEVAFTHLNRLVAFKMMEARGLIRGTLGPFPAPERLSRTIWLSTPKTSAATTAVKSTTPSATSFCGSRARSRRRFASCSIRTASPAVCSHAATRCAS